MEATAARKVRILFSISEKHALTFLEKILSYGLMIAAKMRQRRARAKFHGARHGGLKPGAG